MPKKLINDYIFYKIVCLDDSCELCYTGSTANWKARNYKHKFNCTNEKSDKYNLKVYKTIRANGGWDNFKMIQIGTRPQLTFRQAEQIEEDYRVELKATMNGKRCYLTEEQKLELRKERNKEYRENNKDYINKYNKQWRTNNDEYNKEYKKEKIACDCGCIVARSDLAKHKRTQKHIEFIELVQNKDNIKANTIDKVVCECGCQIRRGGLSTHKKKQKHIKLMELLQNN